MENLLFLDVPILRHFRVCLSPINLWHLMYQIKNNEKTENNTEAIKLIVDTFQPTVQLST